LRNRDAVSSGSIRRRGGRETDEKAIDTIVVIFVKYF
jgi:hypothetical protein